MIDHEILLKDMKEYSPYLDQVDTNYESVKWWRDGWYIVSTNINDTWKPNKGDEIQGIYLGSEEIPSQRDDEKTYRRFILLTPKGITGVNEAKIMQDYSSSFKKGQILWFKFLDELTASKTGNQFRKYFVRAKDLVPLEEYKPEPKIDTEFITAKTLKDKMPESEEVEDEPEENHGTMADQDDPDAENTIKIYQDLYRSENYREDPTDEDLVKMVDTDPDLKDKEITKSRIKAQIAVMVNRGDIPKGG
ncbi:MAG: hypothetical protein AMQ22_00043 [Candidatus Methanofastidiosum methylothiophilum]|uniref:Uncharacterized protein n=1 Tax=Candidatus Methanofastidiosum methylothiophilum TaxID=1705564 RepID=A0A150JA73_9EURY|nr:MAG: hypothetical protein AMQ22_00043 [Candidatus Methanofastidiosum methylthiophilus]